MKCIYTIKTHTKKNIWHLSFLCLDLIQKKLTTIMYFLKGNNLFDFKLWHFFLLFVLSWHVCLLLMKIDILAKSQRWNAVVYGLFPFFIISLNKTEEQCIQQKCNIWYHYYYTYYYSIKPKWINVVYCNVWATFNLN